MKETQEKEPAEYKRQAVGYEHSGEIRKFPRKKYCRIRVGQLVRLEKGWLVPAGPGEDVLGVVLPQSKSRRLVWTQIL